MIAKLSAGTIWLVAALLSVGVALFSYRYLTWSGPLAPNVVENPFAHPWLVIHAGGAGTALLIGAVQLVPWIGWKARWLHRWSGRLYVIGCIVGGVSGLVLAMGATAGPAATAGFGLLAILWLYVTMMGWRMAVTRRFEAHRRWMIRSWALTFAAVTLRIYLPMIPLTGLSFLDGYRIISFFCWIPNLAVAEIYLAFTRSPQRAG